MTRLDKARKAISGYIAPPVVRLLAKTPVTPNTITCLGFCLAATAAVLVVTGHLLAAGLVVLFGGLFDMLDGALARATNRVTRFGGILDSTLDRLSEAVLLLSLLVIYTRGQQVAGSLLVGLALIGSLMVSYLRARIEAIGIECRVGLFTRTERVMVLALGLLLSPFDNALMIAVAVITVFSWFTAGQRLFYAWSQTKAPPAGRS